MVRQFNHSTDQVAYLRDYTPDVVAALTNLGQAGSYYDANGHYVRTQPSLFAFALNSSNQLITQFPGDRYQGLQACTIAARAAPSNPRPTARPR